MYRLVIFSVDHLVHLGQGYLNGDVHAAAAATGVVSAAATDVVPATATDAVPAAIGVVSDATDAASAATDILSAATEVVSAAATGAVPTATTNIVSAATLLLLLLAVCLLLLLLLLLRLLPHCCSCVDHAPDKTPFQLHHPPTFPGRTTANNSIISCSQVQELW